MNNFYLGIAFAGGLSLIGHEHYLWGAALIVVVIITGIKLNRK